MNELAKAIELLRTVEDLSGAIAEFIEEMEAPIARVYQDDCAESPRSWDNCAVMYCKHSRYDLGDKDADPPYEEREGVFLNDIFIDCEDFEYILDMLEENNTPKVIVKDVEEAFENWEEHKVERKDIVLCYELYLYDHSGITIRMGSFSCPWDSSQVGVIYMTKKSLEENFNGDLEAAKKCMEGEVKIYDQYLRGNTWGFTIEDHTGEILESCCGLFGDDFKETGMMDCAEDKYAEILEAAWENRFDRS